ncbi:ribosome-inactivating family protein [Streptomyces sp. HD]|uniref:ribosome-inactivating family protein n=1 Tax=Streptomyces sp. HD TaxID=3020892 RepID=UPI00232AF4F9|nr:ribosome-inactivating family protein [Streptomyces sp. HD]MDC0770479.1 ribosome-inactivating family protein [Streptomyces sp. HD]
MSTEIAVGSLPRGRRSRTTIATAGAVLLALCLALLSPIGAAKAFAIDDERDVTWDISQGKSGYQQMIKDVRNRVHQQAIYGAGSAGTVYATGSSTDYFLVNVFDGPNLQTRLVVNAHSLYVQGYYNPNDRTYRYTSDADLRDVNWMPSTSANPAIAMPLPFSGNYAGSNGGRPGLTNYSGQGRTWPIFSTDSARSIAQQLANTNSADSARAGALLWFVEAVAEGARFNAISSRITAGWGDWQGYHFDADDVGLITNWQSISDDFQRRLQGQNVAPPAPIGRYDFSTLANTAAIFFLMMWIKA